MKRYFLLVLILLFFLLVSCFELDINNENNDLNSNEKKADTSQCYSPEDNLEYAYNSEMSGCDCSENDEDVCVNYNGTDIGLVCESGKWLAVEDGPCMPLPPSGE